MRLLESEYRINTVVANPPAHTTVPFLAKHTGPVDLPVTENIAERSFCLPVHPLMSDSDDAYMCAALIDAVDRLN